MKVKGITRKLDDLGRVVVPAELRRSLKIEKGQYVEMVLMEERLLIKANNYENNKRLEEYTEDELIKELGRRA